MSTTTQTPARSSPTEDAPDHGRVCVHGVELSEAERWVEGDEHVIRSTEFDLIASGATLEGAVSVFVDNAEDYLRLLTDVISEERATEHEVEAASRLMGRFLEAYERVEDELQREARRLKLPLLRRRIDHPRGGFQSSPRTSSKPQPV